MVDTEETPVDNPTPDAASPSARSQVGNRIFKATGALLAVKVVLRGFGVIEKVILGHVIGADYRTDAYQAARDIASYLLQFVDNVVMHSFLPVFVQRMREQGEKDAWRFASTIINLLALFLAVASVIGIVFTPTILHVLEPNWYAASYNPDLIPLTIKLTRTMMVAMIFLAVTSLTYSLLNSYKQFALPASADLALKGTVLACAVLFIRPLGPYALALGFVVGAIAKLAVHSIGLGKRLAYYEPKIDLKQPGVKQFGLLVLPLMIGIALSTVRQMTDQNFGSHELSGSWAALKFAKQLTDAPVDFFPLAFGIALFPFLADIASAGDKERLRGMLMIATRMMILIFLPLSALYIILRQPIVFMLFSHKSIAAADPLQIFAIQMFVGALEIIVLQFFFAMSDTFWPTVASVLVLPLHLAISSSGIFVFHWGIISIALALLCSRTVKIVLLYGIIRKRLGNLEGRRTALCAGKVILAALPLVAILLLVMQRYPYEHLLASTTAASAAHHAAGMMGKIHSALKYAREFAPYLLGGGLGFILYGVLLHVLRVEEFAMLLNRLRRKNSSPVAV